MNFVADVLLQHGSRASGYQVSPLFASHFSTILLGGLRPPLCQFYVIIFYCFLFFGILDLEGVHKYCDLPHWILTWQSKNNHLKMYLLLKTVIYHCDVSFQGCNMRVVHQGIRFVWQPFQWASWMSLGCSFWWIGFSSIGDSGQKAVIWESWSVPVTSRCFWYG